MRRAGPPFAALSVAILLSAFPVDAQVTLSRSPEGAILRGPTSEHRLALIFTGHEFAEGGETILTALTHHRAHASFFLTGDFLRRPDFAPLVRRIVADGHYVGPHSDKHLLYCDWGAARRRLVTHEAFRLDLDRNVREIERLGIARKRVRYFLPAYEWFNADIVSWARGCGLSLITLTPGTRAAADYTEEAAPNFVPSQAIIESIMTQEREDPSGLSGWLLLMHIGAGPRRADKLHDRLDALLNALSGKGYRFVRVDNLLDPAMR